MIARSRRDGTPAVKVWFYPTEAEIAEIRTIARYRQKPISQVITEAVKSYRVPLVTYAIVLSGKLSKKAEILATRDGWDDAAEWFQDSIEKSIEAAWPEKR